MSIYFNKSLVICILSCLFILMLPVSYSEALFEPLQIYEHVNLAENQSIVNIIIQYDLKTGTVERFPIPEKDLLSPFVVSGGSGDDLVIAAEDCETYDYVLYEWKNGVLGEKIISIPSWIQINEYNFEVNDIIAFKDDWVYLIVSKYATKDGWALDNEFCRVKKDQYQFLGTQRIDDSIGSYDRAAVSSAGTTAYWQKENGVYGICVVQPAAGDIVSAFYPIFKSENRLSSFNGGEYYMPASPIIWKDESTVLCFAVRYDEDKDITYSDTFEIDLISKTVQSYCLPNGQMLSLPNTVLGDSAVILESKNMIIATVYQEPSSYWIDFEGTPSADTLATISLETGEIEYLTNICGYSSSEVDGIVLHGENKHIISSVFCN